MVIDTVRLIEELAANAWRPETEQHVGGWRFRYTGGESRRVNSVWPNRPPAAPDLGEMLAQVETFYTRRGAIPRYQMCPAAQPENLAQALEDRGFTFSAHTDVKTTDLDSLLAITKAPELEIVATPVLTEDWFAAYTTASGYKTERLPIRWGILTRVGPPAHFVLLKKGDQPVATGLGVAERGWLGVFCVVTFAEYRRQGQASAVMNALAAWGQLQGAGQIYLQVMKNNPPALALYDCLGFRHLYQYSYAEKR
jgi:ribosomal protein S18 acetylase RimI-like enzyme